MEKVIENTKQSFGAIHTSRASVSFLDAVRVDYYGTAVPIDKIASIGVRDLRSIEIKSWDKKDLEAIEKAILKANLGVTPINDGKLIRIEMPELTESRRMELTKIVKKIAEDHRIELRNIRRKANEQLKALNTDAKIPDDAFHDGLEHIQKMTDQYMKLIDTLLQHKEKEIMEI